MKFIVRSYVSTDSSPIQRAYNCFQEPTIGVEYECDEGGFVKGMSARIVFGDVWLWYPESTSYSSYYFKSTPFRLELEDAEIIRLVDDMFKDAVSM